TAFALAVRTGQTRSVDAIGGQVFVHGARATLRQGLFVGVRPAQVGVAGHFNAQLRVTAQDLGRLAQDRHRVGTQRGLVEVEVDALQVDRDRHRVTVRTDGLARLRIGALVDAVVHPR